jgi:hypothetical protein
METPLWLFQLFFKLLFHFHLKNFFRNRIFYLTYNVFRLTKMKQVVALTYKNHVPFCIANFKKSLFTIYYNCAFYYYLIMERIYKINKSNILHS